MYHLMTLGFFGILFTGYHSTASPLPSASSLQTPLNTVVTQCKTSTDICCFVILIAWELSMQNKYNVDNTVKFSESYDATPLQFTPNGASFSCADTRRRPLSSAYWLEHERLTLGPWAMVCPSNTELVIEERRMIGLDDMFAGKTGKKGFCVPTVARLERSISVNAGLTDCVDSEAATKTSDTVLAWTTTSGLRNRFTRSLSLSVTRIDEQQDPYKKERSTFLDVPVSAIGTSYRACAQGSPGQNNMILHIGFTAGRI